MKKIIQYCVIISILLTSCNTNRDVKNKTIDQGIGNKEKIPNKTETLRSEPQNQLDTNCCCPEPYKVGAYEKIIKYGERELYFCSWGFDEKKLTYIRFSIFDDHLTKLIEIEENLIDHRIASLDSVVRIVGYYPLPSDTSDLRYGIPAIEYSIMLKDTLFSLDTNLLYVAPKMSVEVMDSLVNYYYNRPILSDIKSKDNPSLSEEYLSDMFTCALNGNPDCERLFDSLSFKFSVDGYISSEYYLLSKVYNLYIHKKTNANK